jgi:hypothetical protein
MSKRIHYDYPYRLRIVHEGGAGLQLERKGRWIRIDPVEQPSAEQVVLLTSAERSRGTVEALKAGLRPTIVATATLLDWLKESGSSEGFSPPCTVDGIQVESLSYSPLPSPVGNLLRMGPATALRQLSNRIRVPSAEPQVFCLHFEDGSRLLHLDLSLHQQTSAEWVEQARQRFGGAEWVIVGCPHGEAEAVVRLLPQFSPKKVLLTELVNTERRKLGLPIELVTPTRDRLVHAGLETHVFAPHASYRFE